MIEVERGEAWVGLHAPYKVGGRLVERAHERVDVIDEALVRGRARARVRVRVWVS